MYSERVINNTSKDSVGSMNWKSDWAKFKNKSYAAVVKQNTSKKLGDENQSVKVHNISHVSEKHSQNYKTQWSNVPNDRASVAKGLKPLPKINYVKNQSQNVSEVDVLPTHNRFQVLNNIDFNTNCASQYYINTVCDTLTKIAKSKQNDGSCVTDKLVHKNAEKTNNNVVKQCQLANKVKIKTSVSNGNVSNDTRCNYAGELEVTGDLSKNSVRRRREAVSCETDKYELDLRFKTRHRDIIASASECNTFKNWNDQNHDKFGFIPLGDLILPSIELKKHNKEKIFDIHRRIKASGEHNYMKCQIQIHIPVET